MRIARRLGVACALALIASCTITHPLEYLGEGADAVTSRCGVLLSLWRENLWPVLHLKRIAQAAWFNPASNLTAWIEQFRPRGLGQTVNVNGAHRRSDRPRHGRVVARGTGHRAAAGNKPTSTH